MNEELIVYMLIFFPYKQQIKLFVRNLKKNQYNRSEVTQLMQSGNESF